MHLIACVDEQMGLLFNGRRQSRDRAVRQDIIAALQPGVLWCNPYTRAQFTEELGSCVLRTDPHPFLCAGQGESCFLEDGTDPASRLSQLESVTLYCWNRRYPADVTLAFHPARLGWRCAVRIEFQGYSHEKITKEVYVP